MTAPPYQAVGHGIGVQGEVSGGITHNTFHIVVGVPPSRNVSTGHRPPPGPVELWREAFISLSRAAAVSARLFMPPHMSQGDDETWE